MKLLFDQNISYKIVNGLHSGFNGSIHIKQAGLENYTDRQIWEHAKLNGFTIVTFDADFGVMSAILGHPPKIIWLRTGNTSTSSLKQFLDSRIELIKEFITSESYSEVSCLELV